MSNKFTNVSYQSAKEIIFDVTASSSTTAEFTNGFASSDALIETEFNIEGEGLIIDCYARQTLISATGTAHPFYYFQAGTTDTAILLDDVFVQKPHGWNQKAIFQIKNRPFSKITIQNYCFVNAAKSIYRDTGTLLTGYNSNTISMHIQIL